MTRPGLEESSVQLYTEDHRHPAVYHGDILACHPAMLLCVNMMCRPHVCVYPGVCPSHPPLRPLPPQCPGHHPQVGLATDDLAAKLQETVNIQPRPGLETEINIKGCHLARKKHKLQLTQSQESNVSYAAMRIKTHLDNALYLCSLI